jgi:hypothetical protein
MNRFLPSFLAMLFVAMVTPNFACGYGYIGDCSTGVHLSINGTVDSFEVATCPYLKSLDGLDLGSIQSLSLVKATSITWESCMNNVTGVQLLYNVHKVNEAPANWLAFNLDQDYHVLDGPYDTRYRSKTGNINLLNGLTVGQDYILEVYFVAIVDTIGDDFIPETTLKQNNKGKNYKVRFRYDGPNGPPFTVVTTLVQPLKCHNDQSGRVGVSVYGNQSNLFYQWSNVNNNFFAQFNLAAGTYTVTVSGVNGYTQARTIVLEEPPAIQVNVLQTEVAFGCNPGNNDSLSVTLSAANNAQHPSYQWLENGQVVGTDSTFTEIVHFPLASLSVKITDAQGCQAVVDPVLIVITQYPALNLYLAVQNCTSTTANDGSLSALIVGGKDPYNILWSNGASTDIITNLTPGFYCITLTDGIGCTATNCAQVTAPIAVLETENTQSLVMQPNPVRSGSEIMLQPMFTSFDNSVLVQLFSSDGRLVFSKNMSGIFDQIRLNIEANTPPGQYWVQLRQGEKSKWGRLIVY